MRRISLLTTGPVLAAALLLSTSTPAAQTVSGSSSIVLSLPSATRVSTAQLVPATRALLLRASAASARVSLQPEPVRHLGTTRVVRFHQTYKGLPVIGRGAAAAIDQSGVVRLATASLEDNLPSSVVPTLSGEQASQVAAKRSGLPANVDNTRLILWPTPDGVKLAYSVLPPSLLPIPYAPLVVVDAISGRVLSMQNLVRTENLAKVFEFNPKKTPTPIDVTLPIPAGTTVPQNDRMISYNCVDKKNTQQVNANGFNLTVHVCDLEQVEADATTGDYTKYVYEKDTGGDEPFSEISIYYHANKAFDFFKDLDATFALAPKSTPLYTVANLMLPAGINQLDLNKMADPNVPLEPFPNAFFSGWDPQMGQLLSQIWPDKIKGGSLMFGQGAKIDFAYDGDVVYHEFTHAVVDATIKLVGTWHLDEQGASAAPGAMNEALADYFSSAITGDAASGEYAGQEFGLDAIRHMDNAHKCPANLTGEVHYDSQFFSASLWAARAKLSSADDKRAFDLALYTALTTASTGDLGYEQLADLFIKSVAQSSLGQTVADDLSQQFKDRGVMPVCQRMFQWDHKPIQSPDARMANAFIAAGTSMMPAQAAVPWAPGLFQVEVPIESGATSIIASIDNLKMGGGTAALNPGTPFTPAFIVSYDEPISFKATGGFKTTAEDPVQAHDAGSGVFEAQLKVPSGATKAYVMLVNMGAKDGYYTNVDFSFKSEPQDAGVDSGQDAGQQEASVTPDAGPAQDAAVGQDATAPAEDNSAEASGGGCSCRVQSSTDDNSTNGAAGLALAGLVGLWMSRRRRGPR